jgi:hypothetical protein
VGDVVTVGETSSRDHEAGPVERMIVGDDPVCVCSIESGPVWRVGVFHVSGRFSSI